MRDDLDLQRHLLTAPTGRAVRGKFIPLTQFCADVCHCRTFAKAPSRLKATYLSPEQVLDIARAGMPRGCKEVLFTLGDAPERRSTAARDALAEIGFASTVDYVARIAGLVLRETGLLPHINAGALSADDYTMLRPVSASMGMMPESMSDGCATAAPRISDRPTSARRPPRLARCGRRRARADDDERHPDRHRRDRGGPARHAGRAARPAPSVTAICKR